MSDFTQGVIVIFVGAVATIMILFWIVFTIRYLIRRGSGIVKDDAGFGRKAGLLENTGTDPSTKSEPNPGKKPD